MNSSLAFSLRAILPWESRWTPGAALLWEPLCEALLCDPEVKCELPLCVPPPCDPDDECEPLWVAE